MWRLVKSIPNCHMHSWTYCRVNARVHEKVLVLFQESFNVTTIFLQLRHFLLDDFSGGTCRTCHRNCFTNDTLLLLMLLLNQQ